MLVIYKQRIFLYKKNVELCKFKLFNFKMFDFN